jgi:hypothetical protein
LNFILERFVLMLCSILRVLATQRRALPYPLVGGTRGYHFAGTNLERRITSPFERDRNWLIQPEATVTHHVDTDSALGVTLA